LLEDIKTFLWEFLQKPVIASVNRCFNHRWALVFHAIGKLRSKNIVRWSGYHENRMIYTSTIPLLIHLFSLLILFLIGGIKKDLLILKVEEPSSVEVKSPFEPCLTIVRHIVIELFARGEKGGDRE